MLLKPFLFLLTIAACGDQLAPTNPDGAVDAAPVSFLYSVAGASEFASLASEQNEVKFLLRGAGNLPGSLAGRDCVFANTAQYPLHIQFLRSLPELADYSNAQYVLATAKQASRQYSPGSLYWLPNATHPSGVLGVMAYTFSVDSREAPKSVPQWAEFAGRLRSCAPYPASGLVLVGVDPAQEQYLLANRSALASAGVTVMTRGQLNQKPIEVYSPGETYGYLNVVAAGKAPTDYGPRDIVIADAATDEITTLAGIVTMFPQSFGSHLNVRLREKQLPNLRWVAARQDPRVTALANQLVHLVASANGDITLETATLEQAENFWRARQPVLPPPRSDLTETRFRELGELRNSDALAYGVKAANLGEISLALPAGNRPSGFAIPFSYYASHSAAPGLAASIDQLLADPMIATSRLYREQKLKQLRDAIVAAPISASFMTALAAQLRSTFGASADTVFVRFRSSTNAEDLAEFSGAGLYDSKTGCLADDLDSDEVGPSLCLQPAHRDFLVARRTSYMQELAAHPERAWLSDLIADIDGDLQNEKTVASAVKKVWRSVWTLRAFDERVFYGIDHRKVFMGMAVIPAMVMEQAEAVVFTNLPSGGNNGLYSVTSQVSDLGVVRPSIPTATAEHMTFVVANQVASNFVVHQRSSESLAADLWSTQKRQELANLLIAVQQHFETVYPSIRPLRLDIEVDIDATGATIIKQTRPYLGATQ